MKTYKKRRNHKKTKKSKKGGNKTLSIKKGNKVQVKMNDLNNYNYLALSIYYKQIKYIILLYNNK